MRVATTLGARYRAEIVVVPGLASEMSVIRNMPLTPACRAGNIGEASWVGDGQRQ
jgi:hypothetical protein